MRKLLFISGYRVDNLSTNGVGKKIHLEINTFKNLGFEVDNLELDSGKVYLKINDKRYFLVDEQPTFYKTMDVVYKRMLIENRIKNEYEMVYVRYEHFSFSMIKFFKALKKSNPQIKIVGELPTYMKRPNPGASFKTKISFKIKRLLNNTTKKYIDYLATFSNHDRLFNMPTIKIENFVNITKVNIRTPIGNDTVDLLALAQITPAHGFDRVIKGLNEYYKQDKIHQKVFLHVVGDGLTKSSLENLVNEYELNQHVKFYGALGGEKLDTIFNISDIGIGSLAFFRKGTTKGSELKIREYTARGLPFIYSAEEPQIDGQNFAKKVSFDESPLDINEVLAFYNEIKSNTNLINEMRDFAEKEFTCESQMKKIIQTIYKE